MIAFCGGLGSRSEMSCVLGAGVRLEGFESRVLRGVAGLLMCFDAGAVFAFFSFEWNQKEGNPLWSMLLLFAGRDWGL
jgi:hypothetical protein